MAALRRGKPLVNARRFRTKPAILASTMVLADPDRGVASAATARSRSVTSKRAPVAVRCTSPDNPFFDA
jgi:hypothetical protein